MNLWNRDRIKNKAHGLNALAGSGYGHPFASIAVKLVVVDASPTEATRTGTSTPRVLGAAVHGKAITFRCDYCHPRHRCVVVAEHPA
jgi:hypothetical protein